MPIVITQSMYNVNTQFTFGKMKIAETLDEAIKYAQKAVKDSEKAIVDGGLKWPEGSHALVAAATVFAREDENGEGEDPVYECRVFTSVLKQYLGKHCDWVTTF